MKTIITVGNPPTQSKTTINKTPFLNQALLGLVMCSAAVVANAADSNSFTIKIVDKEMPVSQASVAPKTHSELPKAINKATNTAAGTASTVGSTASASVKPQTQVSHGDNRRIRLEQGGVIWVTTDPVKLTPLLDVTSNKKIKLSEEHKFDSPLSFTLNTNYAAFIHSWELNVYRDSDEDERRPLKSFKGSKLTNGQKVEWFGDNSSNQKLLPGDKLKYTLTVKSKAGHSDITRPRQLTLIGPRGTVDVEKNVGQSPQSNLRQQTIPLHGSRVRIYGNDIIDGNTIAVDGEDVSVNDQRFVVERLLPQGKHSFEVKITDADKTSYNKMLTADVNGRYMFMVGLADLTVGQGNVSANLETLSDGDKYLDGDIFVDGRLAFYLKGKIRGRYLITAQMDTGTNDIKELFDDIHKKDPQSVFSRLDPDQYYPVYGDDSTIVDDTNSQGKMYVRVDWDKSRGIWGNFNTDMTGTELSSFNRSLYGAKYHRKSTRVTKSGDPRTDLKLFASEAQSASRHVEFLGTGGSLYYLKDPDIVIGSEKIWVEVRDSITGRALETVAMEEGRDYQIDDFQGRIILNRPLLQIAEQANPSLIKDDPLGNNKVYLKVDYEYVPDEFDTDKASYGARGKVWLGNHVAIGGSFAHENRNDDDYDLKGIDVTLKKSNGTYLVGEYAETQSLQTAGSFKSLDGGLSYDNLISSDASTDKKGAAYSVEGRVDLEDFSNKKGAVAAWYKNREAGFSSSRIEEMIATINMGLEASIETNDRLKLSTKVTHQDKKNTSKTTTASLQGDLKIGRRLTVGAEVKQVQEKDETSGVSTVDSEGTLAAIKVGFNVSDQSSVYAIGQHTLRKSGAYESNDLVTIGTKAKLTDRLGVNAELSSGDRGDAATAGVDYKLNDSHTFYTNYTHSTDTTFDKRNVLTVGQRKSVSNRLKVFNEHQFTHESDESGLGHTFGVDYNYNKDVTLTSSLQTARFDKDSGETIDRDAVTVGLAFKKGKSKGSSRLEYRLDKNTSGTGAENTEQWVTTNNINYRVNPSFRVQGKLNHSVTIDKETDTKDATFTEAGVGFAFRPINHDRLNVLGRLNYLYDLQPTSQSSDVDEKSLTAVVEGTYQVNQRWQAGGKLANKQSEIRTDRDSGTWTENDASLASVRATYHMNHNWDAMVGYHWMNSDASQDTQHGAMISIDRHIGKKMKIGIGYNFTSFNDDLSDLNGDAEGWFFNLVGKF